MENIIKEIMTTLNGVDIGVGSGVVFADAQDVEQLEFVKDLR